jgi:hypothetical protein
MHQLDAWLCDGIDRHRTMVFLVPLVGPFESPPVPDMPPPGERGNVSPEDLLRLPDESGL